MFAIRKIFQTQKTDSQTRLTLIAIALIILLFINTWVIVSRYKEKNTPDINEVTNACILAVGDAYDSISRGSCYVSSYISEDVPIYAYGTTEDKSLQYLDANFAGLPKMYLVEEEGKLYFCNNGETEWHYTSSDNAEYFKDYLKQREKEFLLNYLNFAEFMKINATETTYRDTKCYDLQFFYDSNKVFQSLNDTPSNGILPFEGEKVGRGKEKDTGEYYEGHYYIRKSDMKVIAFVSMIGETYLYEEKEISLPKELENATPGEIKVNYTGTGTLNEEAPTEEMQEVSTEDMSIL